MFGFNRDTFHQMIEEVKNERSLLNWLTQEYPSVFTKPSSQDLNPKKRVKVRIKPGAPSSLRAPPLRMGAKQADALENIIKQLIAEGKLERGTSPYQSPAFIVTKANGSPRLVVDYRRANELTVPESYPLRRVEDIIADQHGMKYWSQVDLADAFWQLHLDEASRDILAIVTKSGSYRWIALPQGWHSSPIHFQAFVDSLFANVKGVHTYQDDLILSTTTRAGMIKLVKEVFQILSANSLYVKQEKVKLMQTSCNILGFNVSFNKVMPTETLVKKIVDYPCPRNMTELKGFLGLVQFYHDLIPDYTESLLPLSRLAQEKVPWRWTQHQEDAFHRVKTLIQSPELQVCLPDPRKPFVMFVDSSTYAHGAALFQRDGDKILPVSYFSGGYKPAERNYDIGSLELLALRKACAHWKVLLEHNHCDIYTDNSPLSYLLNKDLNQCTKKERKTINELSTYRLKIHHLKGAKNQLADYLSRRSVTVLDMCSGTGGAATVLSALPLSVTCKYYCCDSDLTCQQVSRQSFINAYNSGNTLLAHNPQVFKQDLRAWCHSHKSEFPGDQFQSYTPLIDILIIGYPCQPFSRIGKQRGRKDRNSLQDETIELIKRLKKRNPHLLYIVENVQYGDQVQDDLRAMDEEIEKLGGKRYTINMSHFIPQSRTRFVWSNLDLSDWSSQERTFQWQSCLQEGRQATSSLAPTQMASVHTLSERDGSGHVLDTRTGEKVPMTIEEREALQAMPPGHTQFPGITEEQRVRLVGNAIPHTFLSWIFAKALPLQTTPRELKERWYLKQVAELQRKRAAPSNTDEPDSLSTTFEQRLSVLDQKKRMVKKALRQENLLQVVTEIHNSTHAGQRRTLDLIKTWFDVNKIVDLEETVKRICSECPTCQLCNSHGERSRQYKPVIARAPYDYVCIDFTKVGKTASTGEDTIVTFTEKWSRYVVTVAIKAAETTSADMARIFMRNVYPFFGCPVHIVSDQDVRFTAKYWQNFMKHIGTKLNFTTSYAPWSDGQSELTNRVILNGLKKTLKDYNQWPDLLQVVTEIHNSLPNTVTGVSPSEALFRLPPVPISVRKLLSKEDNSSVYLPSDAQAKEYARELKGMLQHVRAKNEAAARKLQKKRDTRKPIAIGNLVKFILIRDATQRTLGERKTHFIWRGPGKVISKTKNGGAFRIKWKDRLYDRNGRYVERWHGSKSLASEPDYFNQHHVREANTQIKRVVSRDWAVIPPIYLIENKSGVKEPIPEREVPPEIKFSSDSIKEVHFKHLGDYAAWAHRVLLHQGISPQYVDNEMYPVLIEEHHRLVETLTGFPAEYD